MNILAISTDLGATQAIAPIVKELLKKNKVTAIDGDKASVVYKQQNIKVPIKKVSNPSIKAMKDLVKKYKPDRILVGTSVTKKNNSKIEQNVSNKNFQELSLSLSGPSKEPLKKIGQFLRQLSS